LVALHTAGDGPALFFVPGTGGGVVYLHDLARCLGEYGHPFYGFQALGVDGRSPPLTRMEDIAAANIQALRALQPEGPYHLGGHSFGSWVAFEMARQLRRDGLAVAWVAVLDTGAPWERDFARQGGWDDTRWLLAVADTLGHLYSRPLALDADALAGLPWDAQIDTLTRALEASGIVRPGADTSEIRGFIEVYKAQAQIRYCPEPEAPFRLALFRAEELMADFLDDMPTSLRDDETWGWRRYGEVALAYTPGDHLTMVALPHARELARRLHEALAPAG
jgi:thioesterase domain-containing protein